MSLDAREIIRRLGPAAWWAVLSATLPAIGGLTLLGFTDTIGARLRDAGAPGMAAYGAGFALLTGSACLPTYACSALGGWAFGFVQGGAVATVGGLGGALIGYFLARTIARNRAEAIISEQARWRAVRDALIGRSGLRTAGIVTLVRLPTVSPFAITNLALGATRTPIVPYAVGSILGLAPRTFAVAFIASQLRDQLAHEVADARRPTWLVVSGIAMAVVAVMVIGVVAGKALDRATGGAPSAPGAS